MNDNQQPGNALRLKTLLKEAGLKSTRLDASRRLVIFPGRTRDCQEYSPRLFRIVSGDAVLDSLAAPSLSSAA